MVEYGPVELGGRSFIARRRSISRVCCARFSTTKKRALLEPCSHSEVKLQLEAQDALDDIPMQTILNEVDFDQYHLFYTESRVLTADNAMPPPVPESTCECGHSGEFLRLQHLHQRRAAAETTARSFPAGASTPSAEMAAAAAPLRPAPVAAAPAGHPEIRVTAQQTPSIPDVPPGTKRSFHCGLPHASLK